MRNNFFYMYLFKDLKLQQQKINLLGHFDSYKCKYAIKTMWTRENKCSFTLSRIIIAKYVYKQYQDY